MSTMRTDVDRLPAVRDRGVQLAAPGAGTVYPESVIEGHLTASGASWSVGEMGVLAEFHHHGATSMPDPLTVVTTGGAMRVGFQPDMTALAYETPSANPRLWNHGIAFCLSGERARMSGRTRLTEIGADAHAIFGEHLGHVLFDLGLGLRTADFLVRTDDEALIRILRKAEGHNWLEDAALNASLVAASPTRIVVSRLARIEVNNPIPQPAGVSPDGPHTHLLPALLSRRRVHDANIPMPPDVLPCLTLYPAHPARDAEGRERAFDAGFHDAFQALLAQFGNPEYLGGKQGMVSPDSRLVHLGRIIASRQRALREQAAESV